MTNNLDTCTTADARLDPLSNIPSMPALIEKTTLAETLDAYHTALLDHAAVLAERDHIQDELLERLHDLRDKQWEQRELVQQVIAALDTMQEPQK